MDKVELQETNSRTEWHRASCFGLLVFSAASFVAMYALVPPAPSTQPLHYSCPCAATAPELQLPLLGGAATPRRLFGDSPVTKLLEYANSVFQLIPSWKQIVKLRRLLCSVSLDDLGYCRETLLIAVFKGTYVDNTGHRGTPLHVIPIHHGRTFDVNAFVLAKGVKLNLHDHPGMVNVGRILTGSVDLVSYHLTCPSDTKTQSMSVQRFCNESLKSFGTLPDYMSSKKPVELQAVRLYSGDLTGEGLYNPKYDHILRELYSSSGFIVLPSFGNIHEIISKDHVTVLLTVVSPPYDYSSRPVTYFRPNNGTLVVDKILDPGVTQLLRDRCKI